MNREKRDLPDKVGVKFRVSYNEDVMARYWKEGQDIKNVIKSWARVFGYLDNITENKYSYGPGKCLQIEHGNPDVWVIVEIDFLDNMGALVDAVFKGSKKIELWVRFKKSKLSGKIIIDSNTVCLEETAIMEEEIKRIVHKEEYDFQDEKNFICPAQIKVGGY